MTVGGFLVVAGIGSSLFKWGFSGIFLALPGVGLISLSTVAILPMILHKMQRDSQPKPHSLIVLAGTPFVLVVAIIGGLTYLHNGDLESIGHVPNLAATLGVALSTTYISVGLAGSPQQRRVVTVIMLGLEGIALLAGLAILVWFFLIFKP